MQCHANLEEKSFIFFVNYIGFPKDAEKFIFKLVIFNDGSDEQIIVSGPTASIDKRWNEMMESRLSFKLPFQEVKEIWNLSSISVSWEVSVGENAMLQTDISSHRTTSKKH